MKIIEVLVGIVIIGILLLFIWAGYNIWIASHITEGIVVNKRFVPEHVETSTIYHKVGDINIPITNTYIVPDEFIIQIEGSYKEKVLTRTLNIDKISFQLLRVGDFLKVEDLPLTPTAEKP